jgi:hypothetical protein
MPSVADLIFVALLGLLVFTALATKLLGDAGIGWHIRTGQQILDTHSFPRVDPFSSSMQGQPWFAWEWLYDVIVGRLEATLGLNGVTWFTAVIIAATFAWMFRLLVLRGTNLLLALLLALLAISSSTIHFLARPHVLSWLLTLAWFWILDSNERKSSPPNSSARLWLLPILMMLWVNVHGAFLLGFALLGLFWLGALWDWFTSKKIPKDQLSPNQVSAGKRIRDLAWIGLASAAASLANPYGWKLHAHIYGYLTDSFLMRHIEEFQPPTFHGVAQKCFLLLLLSCLTAVLWRGRQLRSSEGLVVLFAVYAGLYATRNIPVSSILLTMVIGPSLPAMRFAHGFLKRMRAIETRMRGHLWPVLAVVATLLIAMHSGRIGSDQLMDAHFDPKRMPVLAVDYLKKEQIKGPILCPDIWGGYLIYRLYPASSSEMTQVVMDDRHDFYGSAFLASYLRMVHVEPGWQEFLQRYQPNTVLFPASSALAKRLAVTPGWAAAYSDDVSIVFVHGTEGQSGSPHETPQSASTRGTRRGN